MARKLTIGDEAPNFDLSSTEGALLMLRDEVVHTAVVLYFFADPEDERVVRDLKALAEHRDKLVERRARPLAIAPLKMDQLQQLQKDHDLPFPLLRDDRGFTADYGAAAAEEGETPAPALVTVDRNQQVIHLANPVASVADALPEIEKLLGALPSRIANYPKKVVNRLVDRWVN